MAVALFQIAEDRIQKIDPRTGRILGTIPAPVAAKTRPDLGRRHVVVAVSGAEKSIRSTLETGAILRTIESNRFVTGVTWVEGDLWHGTGKPKRVNCAASIHTRARSSKA
jgi:hypothetical protein